MFEMFLLLGGGAGACARAQVRAPAPGVPLVAFTLKSEKRTHGYNEFDVADRLRQFGAPASHLCRYEFETHFLSGCAYMEGAEE
jgi:hypothetical protein